MKNPLIQTTDLTLHFPVIGVNQRSFKRAVLQSIVGGVIDHPIDKIVSIRALDNISFELHQGEKIGLIGHNGSGKSSLLKVLAGVYPPTSGSVVVNGSVSSMLDISLGLNHDSTGMENIKLRGLLMGLSPTTIRSVTDEIVEFSDLGEFINLPLYTYSTGMLMRLAFAIATSVTAEIVLLDEWLSVGDAEFSIKAKQRLDEVISKSKLLILASHDQELIKKICTKTINLYHGKISCIKNLLED